MIKNKNDLKFYLDADKFVLNRSKKRPGISDKVWRFQILLRKVEYYKNTNQNMFHKFLFKIYQFRKNRLGFQLGFDIPPNVFGAGLKINHFGSIVINRSAKVGMWCDIHQGVNIGSNNSKDGRDLVPKIGNNVWIGPGAIIFGDIMIGDEVQIAANSVVNKNTEANVTVGGMPAKVLSESGTDSINVAASKSRMIQFVNNNPKYNHYFSSTSTK